MQSYLSTEEVFNFYESCWKEGFNSVIIKKLGSVLRVMLKRSQFFESYWQFVLFFKKNQSFFSMVQFFESYSKKFNVLKNKKKIGSLNHFLIRFNSLSHKRFNSLRSTSLRHIQEKSSILCVNFSKIEIFESL